MSEPAAAKPLVPPDVDLRDFPFMPVDIVRLFGSEFHAHSDDAAWRAGVTLWLRSYHQVPAGSVPDDEIGLARLAEFGRDIKSWRKVRAGALRGWRKCSDGRLYHPVVAEKALEGWIEKLNQRKSSAAGNAKRYKRPFDAAPFDTAIRDCVARLAALNPQSRMLKRASKLGNPDEGQTGEDRDNFGSADNLPAGDHSGMPDSSCQDRKGSEGNRREIDNPESSSPHDVTTTTENHLSEELLRRCEQAAGRSNLTKFELITERIAAGVGLDDVVLPAIREAAKHARTPPVSWKYFCNEIDRRMAAGPALSEAEAAIFVPEDSPRFAEVTAGKKPEFVNTVMIREHEGRRGVWASARNFKPPTKDAA